MLKKALPILMGLLIVVFLAAAPLLGIVGAVVAGLGDPQEHCTINGNPVVTAAEINLESDGTLYVTGEYDGQAIDIKVTADMQRNIGFIVAVANARKLGNRDAAIGVATAKQESDWKNLPYGDRDSLGLFQQRPSQGWGTPSQIMDPIYASNAFFEPMEGVQNRDSLSMMEVAIRVQRPSRAAYESRWKWDGIALALVERFRDPGSITAPDQPVGEEPLVQPAIYTTETACLGTQTETDAIPASASGWNMPLHGNYRISSGFGYRIHPLEGYRKLHGGADFAAPSGTPVYAAKAGVIAIRGWEGSYGNYVKITHEGDTASGYAHLSSFADGVNLGSSVSAGQLIGFVGSTGDSTGAHLHFEIFIGGMSGDNRVDPLPYLRGS